MIRHMHVLAGVIAALASLWLTTSTAMAGEITDWEAGATQGNIRMEARYREDRTGEVVDQSLEVRLDNASRNTVFFVAINGRTIGQFQTNGDGDGTFVLRRNDAPGGDDGRPTGPRINTGDVITVSHGQHSVSGTFVPA